jgi:hypothetical protein
LRPVSRDGELIAALQFRELIHLVHITCGHANDGRAQFLKSSVGQRGVGLMQPLLNAAGKK